MLIAAASVVLPDDVLSPGWVETSGALVAALGSGSPPRLPDIDVSSATVVPGFVDVHVHGGGGGSFQGGDHEQVARAVAFHRAHGTTTTLASLVTAPPADLLRSVRALADLVDDGLLAGIHLEGPWLSEKRAGAHERAQLRDPDPAEVDAFLEAGRGAVRMVTLAPERAGGLEAVRRLAGAGVVVAVGHTEATYDRTRAAVEAGARMATHLFNAMGPLHHRTPGPTLALIEDARVTLELIADGTHVHPALVRHVVASAGPDRVAFVTDAMSAAGMPDGDYTLGSLAVTVAEAVARLTEGGAIAGSTSTMDSLFRSALPFGLAAAVRLTSTTPARALALDAGDLRPGGPADLVVLDGSFEVGGVLAKGKWVVGP
ncbi:MAG: N-acetylglucosamine-6-phosphate deacetylase [Actinomycetes bacterium]